MAGKSVSLEVLAGGVNKIAESSKITEKNVKDIRDAICGGDVSTYLRVIAAAAEELKKKGLGKGTNEKFKRISKVDNKKSISLSRDRDSDRGGKFNFMSMPVEMVKKLKEVNLKDIITAKLKIPIIKSIMDQSKGTLDKFKDTKEVENTFSFLNNSIEVINKLTELKRLRSAKKGVKTINTIYFGNGKKDSVGLVDIFKKLEEKDTKKAITNAPKTAKKFLGFCGSMVLTSTALIAMIPLGVPALLGVQVTSLLVKSLVKVFDKVGKSIDKLKKGSIAMAMLGTCVLSLSVSFFILSKTIKGIGGFKDMLKMTGLIALMTGSVMGVGLAAAGLGKLDKSILKGSLAMAAMGGGLLGFSVGFSKFKDASNGLTLKSVGVMLAAIAGTGVAMAGLGLAAIPIALGSASVLLIGTSLEILKLSLNSWMDFDPSKPVDNIKNTLGTLMESLGMGSTRVNKDGETVKNTGLDKLGTASMSTLTGLVSLVGAAAAFGNTLMIGLSLGLLKLTLHQWEDMTDIQKPVENIKNALTSLKSILDIDKPETTDTPDKTVWDKIKEKGSNLLDGIGGLLHSASTLGNTVMIGASLALLHSTLNNWREMTDIKTPIDNIKNTITLLKSTIGELTVSKDERKDFRKDKNGLKDIIDYSNQVLKSLKPVKRYLKSWSKFDSSNSIANINSTITGLKSVLGNDVKPLQKAIDVINAVDISKARVMKNMFKSLAGIKSSEPLEKLTDAINRFSESCNNMVDAINTLENMNIPSVNTGSTESSSSSPQYQIPGMYGTPQQLADAISQALKNLNVRLDPSMLDINLMVDGGSGKSVKLTLQD